jgi:hypothetical protein
MHCTLRLRGGHNDTDASCPSDFDELLEAAGQPVIVYSDFFGGGVALSGVHWSFRYTR